MLLVFFFSSRRRHTRLVSDWSSDVCSSDLDLAQETFLKAYDRLAQFDSSKRFGPWLFQIGVNGAIDWLRKHRKRHQLSLNEMVSGERSFDVAQDDPREKAEVAQEVHFVLAQIPVKYRTVLMLRDLEGFPCSEVAAIVGREE